MQKISITGLEARKKAYAGLKYAAEAVMSSVGPFGLNFMLEKGNRVTNDGFTISAELCPTIKDEFERRAALVAHEVSAKTNDMVGDATSTSWGLVYNIAREAERYLPNEKTIKAKKTPAEIIKMIHTSKGKVISELEKTVTPVTSKEELIKSALVSVEDEEIAQLLGSMQWDLGPEGRIIAEDSNDYQSSIERVKGIRLDNGFTTSGLVTNHEKQSLELDNMPVLLTNYTIGDKEILAFRESVFTPLINQKKSGVIIMARAFTSEAIKLCAESLQTGFAIFPINAPYVNQNEVMKDIETIIGGRYINNEESRLEDIYISDIGFTTRIVAQRFNAIITGIDNDQAKDRIDKRIEDLKKKVTGSQSDFEKRMIEERIAQLSNGFAVLKVGSRSTTNRKRLKDKCDDAVNAVRLALKGGTVKGAGQAFKEISDMMEEGDILKRPITCVYDQIVNSAPEEWVIPEWVRDPFLVLKVALENSCDFVGTFASTNGIITTENKKECYCSSSAPSNEPEALS